jgi:hypothetical protein
LYSESSDVTPSDFGILLGSFHRSLPKLPESIHHRMWSIVMQTILFDDEKRKLTMEFFAKDCKLIVGDTVEIWAKELGIMLIENSNMAKVPNLT